MTTTRRTTGHIATLFVLATLLAATLTHAAPPRLNDEVPSAFPDQAHTFSFGWDHEAIKLEGPLANDQVSHDYFKLRYTFNPKNAITFRYGKHDLAGTTGLASPLFDGKDQGESLSLDLALNLHNLATTYADPDNNVAFAAGSAFTMGISATQFQTDIGQLSEDHSLLKAYLLYTTDLSPEMRAHTIFTSSRLSGDGHSGSVNRVGAGLDYTLIDGKRPLTLMVNGVLDVYNFRQPTFNTSRYSRFDVGLRYRAAEDWFASVGYVTVNDSENDTSSSGIYAGLHFVDMPTPPIECCEQVAEPVEAEPAPAEVSTPAETQAALPTTPPEASSSTIMAEAPSETETGASASTAPAELSPQSDAGDDGILIPAFPEIKPRHTAATTVMVRAGVNIHVPLLIETTPDIELLEPIPAIQTQPDLATLLALALESTAETTMLSELEGDTDSDSPSEEQTLLTADTNAVTRSTDESDTDSDQSATPAPDPAHQPSAAGG